MSASFSCHAFSVSRPGAASASRKPRYWITLPDPDPAYLFEGTVEFDRYIAEGSPQPAGAELVAARRGP